MTNKHIKLILTDFDGTLVNTRRANAAAYVATMRESGYALSEEEYLEKYFGMRCVEFLTAYGLTDPAEKERLRLRKIALYPSFFDSVELNAELWAFCQRFRREGGRVWIVSTGSRANIDHVMHHLGIGLEGVTEGRIGCVDGVFSGADAARSKPDPECFVEVMRREGCSPRETLIFEDSAVGLEAADRSGAAYFKVTMR